jgi:hypothetical protein
MPLLPCRTRPDEVCMHQTLQRFGAAQDIYYHEVVVKIL